ncbi:hypothetical protein BUALT_Bualt05G0091800 [Buddleja alternifolia]|uniref:Zinc finger PHD-type domain-containing protein n=1 Tax=Buddleja alternifolia TaxID=168488 RepID=A0AAV6XHY3_9LAMI|nr:hypothetical protein BUALT_Bualt05G0091800 [Buddleja alternifolia]
MKNRSHRFPLSEPRHDDWVDGSWTVDCICGVNFDDGEEMVDCDECGVWVHTRCARYVKSEKSYACDKCKSKNSVGRNDSEETEVAEFLVELPTKTLRMDNPNPSTVSSGGLCRLWSGVPMEERVHVQGVPGGEPGYFSGIKMSSVFGPELWKCTGYVPKKFNFRYTEFPSLSDGEVERRKEEEMDRKSGEENANQADNGAGVLFSLLTENKNTLPTPVVDSFVMKSPVESGTCNEVVSPRQKKKGGRENLDSECPEDSVKKESTSVKPTMLHFGKRKKEELGMSKDQSAKKKVRTSEKEGDVENQAAHASKAASTFSNDAKQLEPSQDRGAKTANDDIICGKDNLGECATNLASDERDPEVTLRNDASNDEISKERNRGDKVIGRSENFSSTNNVMVSLTEVNCSHSTPAKEKVHIHTLQSRGDIGEVNGSVGIGSHDKNHLAVKVGSASPDGKESENGQESDIEETNSRPNVKLKAEVDVDDNGGHYTRCLPVTDVNLDTTKVMTHHPEPSNHLFEEGKVIEPSLISFEPIDHKLHDGSRSPTVASCRIEKSDDSPAITYLSKREPSGSEGSLGARKRSSGLKPGSEVSEELHKSGTVASHPIASYQRKVVVSVGKSASTAGVILSKSSHRIGATAQKPPTDNRQNELSESSTGAIRDGTCSDIVKEEEKSGRPKKLVKEPSRMNSLPKTSQTTKLLHTSDSMRVSSDSKNSMVPNGAATPVSGECVSSPPQIEGALHAQNKAAASAVPGKGEKSYQSGSQPSSRGHMMASTSSNVPATLSDEELALLLHQELNSSPRVPRVPRMRHAGSLPQLTCPTATSMLMKRTSTGGAKDHGVASRRRTKDCSREGLHGSLEIDNEVKKTERKPSSPDNRKRDSGCNLDPLSRREADGGSVKAVHYKTTNVSRSLSSGDDNGHNVSSTRPSSRNTSDDNPRAVGRLTNRTLPGLIAEIMSEGKRMTYEELCNAVLPHWPHLRKHNGERYAYSSHSQAVLDCLRNRSEWARLVDRGPKTSGSRKRRKVDGDCESIESEDNEDKRVKKAKDVGCSPRHEDFPKGKRKARKRRRLALQGRGVVRRRRRADVVSDDESESFSNSSEEEEEDSMSSEEETQVEGTSITVGNEASASSDELR